MQSLAYFLVAGATGVMTQAPAFAAPLQLASVVLVEQRSIAADGTVRTALAPARRVVPGDHLVVALDYRNTGGTPLANVVFDNPVPPGIAYRAPVGGSPVPLVSVDGKSFGALDSLRVAGRAATALDITHVRWKLSMPIAPGGTGRVAFAAILK